MKKEDILDEEGVKEVIKHLIQTTRGVIVVKKSDAFYRNLHEVAMELGYLTDYNFQYPDKLSECGKRRRYKTNKFKDSGFRRK